MTTAGSGTSCQQRGGSSKLCSQSIVSPVEGQKRWAGRGGLLTFREWESEGAWTEGVAGSWRTRHTWLHSHARTLNSDNLRDNVYLKYSRLQAKPFIRGRPMFRWLSFIYKPPSFSNDPCTSLEPPVDSSTLFVNKASWPTTYLKPT